MDKFHIKAALILLIIVFPIVFIITLAGAWSEEFGDFEPPITFENAPENTAYVDILVKLPESSEDYVDFAEWRYPPKALIDYRTITDAVETAPGKYEERTRTEPVYDEISITPDSEIAKLNDDGYVSLSVHYRNCTGFSDSRLLLDYHGSNNAITAINKRYGKFKAAYVDKNGSVLKITKTARTRFNSKEPSSFTVSGETLTFTKWSISPLQYILLGVSGVGEPLAIVALIVCRIAR